MPVHAAEKANAVTDRPPSLGLLWPTVAAVLALATVLSLGTWQLQRKAWKDGLVSQIAARARAEPIPLAAAAAAAAQGRNLEYTRVVVRGRFLADKTLYLYAPERGETGWHAYAPLETADGLIVLVNRGYVSNAGRNASPPLASQSAGDGEVEIVGLLRHPAAKGAFIPANDISRNIWHWRDIAGMAQAAFPSTPRTVLPLSIDREADPTGRAEPGAPRGGVTRISLPNRHLEYALTWYGLGAALLGVYVTFTWSRWRSALRSTTTGRVTPTDEATGNP